MLRLIVLASCLAVALGYPQPRGVPRLDGRIVGGQPADIRDYPYQISLRVYGSHICGGSIVNSRQIVTAAHCTDGQQASTMSIRAGSTDRTTGGQVINVARINQNPMFSYSTLDFDASILELEEDLVFGTGVEPIYLTSVEPSAGEECVVSGWGTTSSGGSAPQFLREVSVHVVDRDECSAAYGRGKITSRMFCAADPNRDSCQGDSGGPLASNGALVGIVSWGYGCADPIYPGVYSNVANIFQHSTKKGVKFL